MAAFSSRQWIAISVSVIVFASLFFVNRKAPPPEKADEFLPVLEQAKKDVPADQQNAINNMANSLTDAHGSDERIQILKRIITKYDSLGAVIPGTYYTEKLAEIRNSADLWYKAAERYYNASEAANQQTRGILILRASQCYANSYKIDSTNLDTRVGMGKCLVEGSSSPMQGIAMINAVIKKDSNNLNAQLALGELSVQSGQLPKAIYRFRRVLQIDSAYIDGYLYLADVYQKSGNKEDAIGCLKKYSTFVTDKKIVGEINTEIEKIKNDTITNK
jgi:tetratricopeptide (TPR) repeat protein